MVVIKQILICYLVVFTFGNKSRFVYGVKCEFCRKDFEVLYQNISGGVKIAFSKTNIP